jgi:hypothetical protein
VAAIFQRTLAVVLLPLAELSAQTALSRDKVVDARIQVRVWNSTHIQPEGLNRAKAIADKLFNQAGIELAWMDCSPEPTPESLLCASPTSFNDISVRICTTAGEVWPKGNSLWGGLAVRLFSDSSGSGLVILSADRLERAAREEDLPLELVLGVTMAHEIGHLLMTPTHSIMGIMQGRLDKRSWQLARQGQLQFLRKEAKRMRKGVVERQHIVAASGKSGNSAFDKKKN